MPPRLRRLSALVAASFFCFFSCTLLSPLSANAGQDPRSSSSSSSSDAVRMTPAETLRSAQIIFIRTKSIYFKPAALEQQLLDRSEIQSWGMVIAREEADADLIIEVDRKLFTNRFVYSVLDPRTNRVLLSGKIGSLGGTVERQIASGFVKRIQPFRVFGPPVQAK